MNVPAMLLGLLALHGACGVLPLTQGFAAAAFAAGPEPSADAGLGLAACYPVDGKGVGRHRLEPGAALFTDRPVTCGDDIPERLAGLPFFKRTTGIYFPLHLDAERAGMVYAITPEEETSRFSRAEVLRASGFEKSDIAAFPVLDGETPTPCEVWERQVARDDAIRVEGAWVVIVTEVAEFPRAAEPGAECAALLEGAPAVLEPLEWEVHTLDPGASAFLDREHSIENVPESLAGRSYIRSSFCSTRLVCRQAGVVLAVTPAEDQNAYSQAASLEQLGFRETEVPEFMPFGEKWPVWCRVWQKAMRVGERLDLGRTDLLLPVRGAWTLVVAEAPQPSGAVGDQQAEPGNPFATPLAQDYTIAAEVSEPQREFVHDPGMCVLPSGAIIAATPVWGRNGRGESDDALAGPKYLRLTRSRDGGTTWDLLHDLPYAEGTPFVVDDALYLFTQPYQHQDVYFMRSRDEGATWEGPVKVLEGALWNCQTSMVVRDDTLYWVLDERHQGLVPIAGDLTGDLLDPASWRKGPAASAPLVPSEFRLHQAAPAEGNRDWVLETNLMLVKERLMGVCRVNPNSGHVPNLGALWEVLDDDEGLRIEFENFIPWQGGHTKAAIVHDPHTNLFWKAANLSVGFDPARFGGGNPSDRGTLALFFGFDGITWLPAGCIARAPTATQSFMYPSIAIDGADLVVLSRSARRSGYHHDADLSTFHRVKDFRNLAWF